MSDGWEREKGVFTTTPLSQAKYANSTACVIREKRAVMYPAMKTKIANSLFLVVSFNLGCVFGASKWNRR